MAERKEISAAVLVAKEGDSAWRPLVQVALEQGEALAVDGAPGACPSCGHVLALQPDATLPHTCPSCGRAFRPAPGCESNLWYNFTLALRQYAKFSGRATRMEYWSFTLFNMVLGIILQLLVSVCESVAAVVEESLVVDIVIVLIMILLTMLAFALLIPGYAVMVRRLHDVGRTGKWVWGVLLGWLVAMICVVGAMSMLNYDAEQVSEVLTPASVGWLVVAGVAYLELIGVSLFIFVLSFFDSQRGPNKYGPSRKYPMG